MSKKYLLGIIYLSLFPVSLASLAFQEQQYNPVVLIWLSFMISILLEVLLSK
ncbi:hypothetical protein [Providencia hangzhouensis]|uniref:hypothetical protein n=1 Tax=Providencia hangzhouensis TaxID=3031799 RepID=UPI0034DD8733